MPRFMRCIDGDHYYVLAGRGQLRITYQLTRDGLRYLMTDRGILPRETFSTYDLRNLIKLGWAYTGGSGVAGMADSSFGSEHGADADLGTPEDDGPPHRIERRLQCRFESADHGTLDSAVERLVKLLNSLSAHLEGPYPLPVRVERYTSVRCQAIDGARRAVYEVRTHKRVVTIVDADAGILAAMQREELPPGVSVSLRQTSFAVVAHAQKAGDKARRTMRCT